MTKITNYRAVLEQMVDALGETTGDDDDCGTTKTRLALTAGRAALTTPPHTSPDPQGAYESRCAIDGIQHDKASFITGYEQGS